MPQMFVKLVLVWLHLQQVFSVKKCCDYDHYLKRINATYECVSDVDKRVQIFPKEDINFININNSTNKDNCYDVDGSNITEFKIIKKRVIEANQIEANYFPKCCPLHNYYNSKTHSCAHKQNVDTNFITRNFLKIGLPHCKIIGDYQLTGKTYFDFEYRLEMATLARGTSNKFNAGLSCVDKDEQDNLIMRACEDDFTVCSEKRCVHKCCPDGQSFVDGKNCRNTYAHGLDLSFSQRINKSSDDESFAVIHNLDCRMYILTEQIQYHLDQRGLFWVFENKSNTFVKFSVDQKSYCIEHLTMTKNPNSNGYRFFMCFPDTKVNIKFLVERWAKLISCIFIFFTILVYIFLPHLLNLFGSILLSYCVAVLLNFSLLTFVQFVNNHSDTMCTLVGFVTLLMGLCDFSWLNVMCFDIQWTFGSPKSFFTANHKRKERKRFLMYSLYGWGIPLLITLITGIIFIHSEDVPHSIKPFLGTYKCFLEDRPGNYGFFIYYAIPLLISQMVNLVLFVKTIVYFVNIKSEINKMNESTMVRKKSARNLKFYRDQLAVIVKLSVIMGISFLFEAVSSLYKFSEHPVLQHVEIVFDTFNCLQGLFIFVIFVCKESVLSKLLCRAKRQREMSLSTSNTAAQSLPLTSKF